jgi:hypothetical protein
MDDSQNMFVCPSPRSPIPPKPVSVFAGSSSRDKLVSVLPIPGHYQEDQLVPDSSSIPRNHHHSVGEDFRKDYKLVPVLPPLPNHSQQDQHHPTPRSARTIPNNSQKGECLPESTSIHEYPNSEELKV